jgi:hypothetical protein
MKNYQKTLQKRRQRKAAIKEIKKHSASIFVICFVLAAIGMTTVAITGKMQAAEPVKILCEHDWYMDECRIPTCDTEGYYHSTCLKCGMEKSNTQEALKHDTVSREMGTTEDGETIVYVRCKRCGDENTFYN